MGIRLARTLRAATVATVIGAAVVAALPPGAGAAMRPSQAPSKTVWLCRPGQTPDPCTSEPRRHLRGGERRDPGRAVSGVAERSPLRLLLRVPDGLDRTRDQRRPHRPAGRAGGGDRPGVTVLPAVHRLGPDVPPGHGGGAGPELG